MRFQRAQPRSSVMHWRSSEAATCVRRWDGRYKSVSPDRKRRLILIYGGHFGISPPSHPIRSLSEIIRFSHAVISSTILISSSFSLHRVVAEGANLFLGGNLAQKLDVCKTLVYPYPI